MLMNFGISPDDFTQYSSRVRFLIISFLENPAQ